MINIKHIKNNNNKIQITYKVDNTVETKIINFKPLKIEKDNAGSFVNTIDNENYSINPEGSDYAYTCLYNRKFKNVNYYLNTVLQLKELLGEDFIDNLEPPKLVFYDIETNEYAIPKKDNKNKIYVNKRAKINSIAWIDEQGKEHILVRGVNGSEKRILEQFIEYLKDNDVMGLVGHNSFRFDNIVCKERIKALGINYKYLDNIFYNQCNLDTMVLASFLQYTPNRSISLNNLSELLKLNNSKTNLGNHNPITLYTEAIKEYKNHNNKKLDLFKEYNLQDVRLTKACFENMNSLNSCIDIFKETLCRFDKLHKNQELLNSYVCNVCYNDYKKVIPKFTDTEINFENKGGYNYYNTEQNKELQVYNNVVCFDIVSYYPNLLRLIQADTTNPYNNVNKDTGEIKEFGELTDGLLDLISENLFKPRISIKQEMNTYEKGSEEYNTLNREQQAKKIIVNSLYGVLNTKQNGYFILKNELICALITKIGREILKEIRKEFKGVYAKTDSIFIELKNTTTKEELLKELNDYLNIFLKSTYNLNNIRDNEQLIRFEIDKEMDKLIIKDKNNYCWFENKKQHYKGSDFSNSNKSQFEKNLIKEIMDLKINNKSNDNITENIINYASEIIENNKHHIKYFSQKKKITKKTKDKKLTIAKEFLTKQGYQFEYNNMYNYCCIENEKYSYTLYNNNYNFKDNTVIKKEYCLKLCIDTLKNLKIIDTETKEGLYEKFRIDKFNNSINSLVTNTEQTGLTSDFENNTEIIPFDKTKNKKLKKLNELITDTSEYYNKGYLKFIGAGINEKRVLPPTTGFKFTSEEHINKLQIDKLGLKSNIMIITNYKGLSCLDIDGAKGTLTPEQNKDLTEYLLKILKSTGYPFIIQKSISEGYHLFYCENENTSINFNFSHIYYPENFKIKDLKGKSLADSTIEVFNTSTTPKQVLIAPSSYNTKDLTGEYKLLEDNYKWEQIFNNKTNDLYTSIEEQFKNYGFKIGERKQHEPKQYNTNYIKQKPKELNDTEITKVTEACNELMELANKTHCKHYLTIALAGVFSNYHPITENSLIKIMKGIVSETGKLMRNTKDFEKTLKETYENNREDKTGFPKIRKLLVNHEDKANKWINIIRKCCRNKEVTKINQTKEDKPELIDNKELQKYTETIKSYDKITVAYTGEKYIIIATETAPNILFNYTVYNKRNNTFRFFYSQPPFKEHHNSNSEFAQYTKSLLNGDIETKEINFGKALKNLDNQYNEKKAVRDSKKDKLEAEKYDVTKPKYDKDTALDVEKNISSKGFFKYIDPYLNKVHLGNHKNIYRKTLVGYSIVSGEGSYFSHTSGDTEKGKSLEDEITFLYIIPQENIVKINMITGASLTREGKYWLNRKIVYLGDLGGKKDFEKAEDILNIVKILITEGYYSKLLTENKKGEGHENKLLELETESVGLVFQSVKNDFAEGDTQLLSRTIENTPATVNDKEILDFIFYCKNEDSKQAKERKKSLKKLEKMQEYIKYLINKKIKITNPFRRTFIEYSEKSETEKRELNQQLELFKAYCTITYTECEELLNENDSIIRLLASKKQLEDFFNNIALGSVLNPYEHNFLKMIKADGNINELTLIDDSDPTALTPYFNKILEEMGEEQKGLEDNYNNYSSFDDLDPQKEPIAIKKLLTKNGMSKHRKKETNDDTVFFTVTRIKGVYRKNKDLKNIKENVPEILYRLYNKGYLGKLDYKDKDKENIYYLTTKYFEIIEPINFEFSEEEKRKELEKMGI